MLGMCDYVGRESYLYFLQMIWLTGVYLLHQLLFLYSPYPLCKVLRMELTHRLKLLFGIANNNQLDVEAFLELAEAYEACVGAHLFVLLVYVYIHTHMVHIRYSTLISCIPFLLLKLFTKGIYTFHQT